MAHSLEMEVVAEGVEEEGHLQFLKSNGCDEMQGYFLSRPIPAQELEQFLNKYKNGSQKYLKPFMEKNQTHM